MNGRLGAVIVLALIKAAVADHSILPDEELPSYLRGAVSFDEIGNLKLHGYKEDKPHITFDLIFKNPAVSFYLCTQPRSLCSLPVDNHNQRAVFCLKTESNDFYYKDECPSGMSGVEVITKDADAGSFTISNNENDVKHPIEIQNCVAIEFEKGDLYNYDYMTVRTNPKVKLQMKKLKILERANKNEPELLYFKNTNPKCGVYLLFNHTQITTDDPVVKPPDFMDTYFTVPSPPPPTNATEASDEEVGESVASAAVPVLKIVFIVVGVVVILVFVFVFFFLLYQRKKRKEYQAQSLSDKTPPLLLPKGSSNDVVAPVTPEKAPVKTPMPSTEMQSTPGASKPPPSTAVVHPPSTDQKSATNSAVTAFQPPRGLRAMRTADELYRLALTADVRVERNVYLDLAIESANDEIHAWEKSPAGKRNDTSILPLVAQRIISARQRKLTMLQSKIPNRLLPEQVDGLSYEDINDLALIEMKSMNIRYALFDMACDAIKRAYEEAYATANFDKESVDPLVYQVQLGVLELNEEPLRVAEQRRRLVEDYLRLKGIIVKEGFNSKSK